MIELKKTSLIYCFDPINYRSVEKLSSTAITLLSSEARKITFFLTICGLDSLMFRFRETFMFVLAFF